VSRENVDIVRAVVEANQDPKVLALLASDEIDLGWVDPDVEWDASRLRDLIPDLAEVYHGHEGVRTYWRRWLEAWRDVEFDVRDFIDADEHVVVLIENQRQWGRHTGIVTELPSYAMVFTLRDGILVRWRTFADQESALDAVGLGPQERG
jgi:ketosteroid isomerase-like protein